MDDRCPVPVPHPVMYQRWDSLTFLHWRVDPGELRRLVPRPLEIDTFDGAGWVGLVPFEMQRVRPVGVPTLGRWSQFPETNVRTYVRGPDGGRGVYFFSLDAAYLAVVATARLAYQIPYFQATMSVERLTPETIRYTSLRIRPNPAPAFSRTEIGIGAAITASELDVFLTARWGLYAARGRTVRYTPVEHEPWPLHEAACLTLDDELVTAAGITPPRSDPVVRYSPGVDVRIGRPRAL